MTLKEKLDLLNLSDREKEIAIVKNSATLAIIDERDFDGKLSFLNTKDVKITKAREIKVLTVSLEDLTKNFSVLDEIHESDLYRYEPLALTVNVIDIYKRIKYCIQNNIPYKTEKGYNPAIYTKREAAWKKFIDENTMQRNVPVNEQKDNGNVLSFEDVLSEPKKEEDSIYKIDFDGLEMGNENKVEETPVLEEATRENIFSFDNENISPSTPTEPLSSEDFDYDHIKIDDYLNSEIDVHDMDAASKELEQGTEKLNNTVENAKSAYEISLAENLDKELEMYNNSFDTVSFNDLEPESFGLGR